MCSPNLHPLPNTSAGPTIPLHRLFNQPALPPSHAPSHPDDCVSMPLLFVRPRFSRLLASKHRRIAPRPL
ncbi:hypothetical protein CGRA01v4_08617 [Colletotrichum graminicola]|nr:hypothetical protein CGRA01v4_08617 [Colletotrichum graminicola]